MHTDPQSLLMLLNWMSPTFPIGGFAYSHGMEQAIADRRLRTAEDVKAWIAALLRNGSGWNDAVLFASCWNEECVDANELALALAGSAERYRESTQLGNNFNLAIATWTGTSPSKEIAAYPLAAGRACEFVGIPRDQALLAFLQGFAAAQVSVAVRLVPLGQTRGLEILRDLGETIADVAKQAAKASLGDIGTSCFSAEIAAMQHETLEPRIFLT
jgi:urease accessory protein